MLHSVLWHRWSLAVGLMTRRAFAPWMGGRLNCTCIHHSKLTVEIYDDSRTVTRLFWQNVDCCWKYLIFCPFLLKMNMSRSVVCLILSSQNTFVAVVSCCDLLISWYCLLNAEVDKVVLVWNYVEWRSIFGGSTWLVCIWHSLGNVGSMSQKCNNFRNQWVVLADRSDQWCGLWPACLSFNTLILRS